MILLNKFVERFRLMLKEDEASVAVIDGNSMALGERMSMGANIL